jgi:plasmid stabilization system protein ParE
VGKSRNLDPRPDTPNTECRIFVSLQRGRTAGHASCPGHRVPVTGFPKHLIFYKVEGREVFVLRVIHGARDLENLFAG